MGQCLWRRVWRLQSLQPDPGWLAHRAWATGGEPDHSEQPLALGLLYQSAGGPARCSGAVVFPAHHTFDPHQHQDRLGGDTPHRFGVLLSAAATICLMLGLTWGSSQLFAWSSVPVLAMLGGGGVLFALFLLVERRASEPFLPLSLFRNQVFSMAALLTMLQMMVLLGLSLYLPVFLQGVLASSPTEAGLVITPLSLSMVLGAMLAGPIIGALKRFLLILMTP